MIYLCVKFEVTGFYALEVIPKTKIHSKNLQRAITQKLNEIQLWFLHTALVLYVIYLCVKFEITSFYTLEVMPETKIQSYNLQRAITPKIVGIGYGSCTLHFSTMWPISVWSLKLLALTLLKLCPRQDFIMHRQMDIQTERVTPVYPPQTSYWGIKMP